MTADLLFDSVEFFAAPSGQRIRAKIGETFRVHLNEAPEGYVWASTKDEVLALSEITGLTVSADAIGTSELQVQVDRQVVLWITVEVFDPATATRLNPLAGTPQPK